MRRQFRIALALLLLVVLVCSSALAAEYRAKVLMPSMKVYESKNNNAGVLHIAPQKTSFKVLSVDGDWAKVSVSGKTGYARMGDIIFDDRIAATVNRDASFKFVTRASYKEGKYYKAKAAKGAELYVVGFDGDMALVCNNDRSAIGYISRSAVTKK